MLCLAANPDPRLIPVEVGSTASRYAPFSAYAMLTAFTSEHHAEDLGGGRWVVVSEHYAAPNSPGAGGRSSRPQRNSIDS